jgi:copper chaperone NosL
MRMPTALVALAVVLPACARGPARPAPLDTRNETCRSCRMAVSDARLAAQLVAPGEEPAFFDDIGCLRDYLKEHAALPAGAVAYVADHRTKSWVKAAEAVYTRAPRVATPMASHLLAHADPVSREADADARGGQVLGVTEVFGPHRPPGGSP